MSIRIRSTEVLSDHWGRLTRIVFDRLRRDGTVEEQVREVYDRGDGAAVLPIDADRGTVLLVRQFRLPAHLNRHDGDLIEACAGIVDDGDPETTALREAEEELGYRLAHIERVFEVFMSPGSLTERITGFTARYTPADRISSGGGARDEGEDIEVLELPLARAAAMIASGEIVDAKTIMLIQHVQLTTTTDCAGGSR